jgi:hypothetical protein
MTDMGLFRKMTSLSTLGAVDFRSDKERSARNTGRTANEAKKQTLLMRQQMASAQGTRSQVAYPGPGTPRPTWNPPVAPPVPQGPPAGWYQDAGQPEMLRWYDGTTWTDFLKPKDQ